MKYLVLCLLLAMLFFSSCKTPRYVYSAAPANAPAFSEKGQSKLAAYYSGGNSNDSRGEGLVGPRDFNRGYDLQAAYAFTKNFAVTADFFKRSERDVYLNPDDYSLFNSSIVEYKRRIATAGIGYFTPIFKDRKLFFNLYGGLGKGKFTSRDRGEDENLQPYSRFHNADINKYYIQPGLTFMPERYVSFAFIVRFSFVSYSDISTNYSDDELQFYSLNKLYYKTIAYWESGLQVGFGFRKMDWLKLEGNLGLCSHPRDEVEMIRSRILFASIGLSLDLSRLKN